MSQINKLFTRNTHCEKIALRIKQRVVENQIRSKIFGANLYRAFNEQ